MKELESNKLMGATLGKGEQHRAPLDNSAPSYVEKFCLKDISSTDWEVMGVQRRLSV